MLLVSDELCVCLVVCICCVLFMCMFCLVFFFVLRCRANVCFVVFGLCVFWGGRVRYVCGIAVLFACVCLLV